MKIYMAGPLFSEADRKQRAYEAQHLREALSKLKMVEGEDYTLFTPIEAPINDKQTLPSAECIFEADAERLLEADIVFADLSGYDAGVMMELGMILNEERIDVFAYDSDLRLPNAGDYEGIRVPYGVNQFVIGGLLLSYGEVYKNFSDAYCHCIALIKRCKQEH